MSTLREIPVHVRILLCAALTALAFLFLGAVRIQDSIRAQSSERADSNDQCRTILQNWNRAVPEQERTAWDKLADEDPAICLRALCSTSPR